MADFHRDLKRQLSRKPTEPRGGVQVNDDRHRRDVEWFYRAKLKDPPTPPYKLAKDYLETRARLGRDQRKIVKAGIARAERILGKVPGNK
jgi:hypothetical protein